MVTEWDPEWSVFDDTLCGSALRGIRNVTQHFDTVTFSKKSETRDMPFGFYVDNTGNTKDYSLMYIYSTQDKAMVFDGYATAPGRFTDLRRYEKEDRAFCLRKNTTEDMHSHDLAPGAAFERTRGADVCGFVIVVTRAKKDWTRWHQLRNSYQTDSVSSLPRRGLVVQTDGGATPHHANLLKGTATDTNFAQVDLEYAGAPIHIYNVSILISEGA